jgi:cytochrome c oxidase assembly protein subunit 15
MLEHRLSKLVALMTFLMLIIGGTVNATGSSLACEWTFRCNEQLFPAMKGGVLFEHGHRQFGWILGFLQIALSVSLWRRRPAARRLAVLSLVMVCVQGALGMVTVAFLLPWYVSTLHLLHGMAYFGVLLYIAYLTRAVVGPLPEEVSQHRARVTALGTGRRWIIAAIAMLFVQLTLGALVRHFEATLVCLDMPACNLGEYWPQAFVQRVHMIHRVFGCLTAIVTVTAAVMVWKRAAQWPTLRTLMIMAPLIAAAQVTLGIYTVLTMRAVPVAVAHFAGATALWGTWLGALLVTGSGRRIAPGAMGPRGAGGMVP